MLLKPFTRKFWLFIVFCLIFILSVGSTIVLGRFVGGRGGRGGRGGGGGIYGHHDGGFYRHGWGWGWWGAGVTIAALPYGYGTIFYGGVPYYYYDNIYYTACSDGYCVVSPPDVNTAVTSESIAQPQITQPQTLTEGTAGTASAPNVSPVSAINTDMTSKSTINQPQKSSGQTVIVNIPNSNGGFTPVKLIKRAGGYIGPQGEYYTGNPTVDQLKVLYGK